MGLSFILFLSCLLLGVSVNANGEFSILHHPRSIAFKGHDQLKESTISEVLSSALGFSNSQFSNWKGIYVNDPFYLAEGLVTISVEGVPSTDLPKGHHFPLRMDSADDSVFNTIKDRINQRYPESEPHIVSIDLQKGLEGVVDNDLFNDIKIHKPKKSQYLNKNVEDTDFLKDVELLHAIADKISKSIKPDGVPDFFQFKVSSLHPLVDLYGDNSTEAKEAKKLLNEAILRLNSVFKNAYNGAVLFTVITSDASHTRKTRSILANEEDRDLNLASDYSEDFPVIFNIILWLCVALGFSLLAISLVIGSMDPGRDSIIYRMTNPRMKKDN